jgi:hypothetical protein
MSHTNVTQDALVTPDEVVLQPEDYDLPNFTAGWAKAHQEKMKQPVKVTRRQMQFFGERGVSWMDVERFYGVSRVNLMRYYAADYEKGRATTNTALHNKMVELALAGNPTMLIWLGKNRLGQGDRGMQEEEYERTEKLLSKMSTEELKLKARELLK